MCTDIDCSGRHAKLYSTGSRHRGGRLGPRIEPEIDGARSIGRLRACISISGVIAARWNLGSCSSSHGLFRITALAAPGFRCAHRLRTRPPVECPNSTRRRPGSDGIERGPDVLVVRREVVDITGLIVALSQAPPVLAQVEGVEPRAELRERARHALLEEVV